MFGRLEKKRLRGDDLWEGSAGEKAGSGIAGGEGRREKKFLREGGGWFSCLWVRTRKRKKRKIKIKGVGAGRRLQQKRLREKKLKPKPGECGGC